MRNWLGAWLLMWATGLAFADPPKDYPFVSYDQGLHQAQAKGKKIFLYFGRFGCGWCAKTNKESFSDASLRKLYTDHYVLVYVDAESGNRLQLPNGERITEMELGARLNVYATPVFIYLEPSGEVILRAPGFKTVKDFRDFDRYIQSGRYKREGIAEFLKGSS